MEKCSILISLQQECLKSTALLGIYFSPKIVHVQFGYFCFGCNLSTKQLMAAELVSNPIYLN